MIKVNYTFTFKRAWLFLLVCAITFSPRFPLGTIPGERRFDLRGEDIIITLMLIIWLLFLFLRSRIYLTPLFKPIFAYTSMLSVSSALNIITGYLNPVRTFFYGLKEIEYFFLFLLVANWICNENDIKYAIKVFLLGAIINVGWVVYQLLAGFQRPLFYTVGPVGHYGPGLIGELSAASTGGFFLIALSTALALVIYSPKRRVIYFVISGALFVAMLASGTRGPIFSFVIALAVVATLMRKGRFTTLSMVVIFGLIAVSAMWYLVKTVPAVSRLFNLQDVAHDLVQVRGQQWARLLQQLGVRGLLFGYGESALGFTLGFEEAHNYYLRVLLESGIMGLATFLWLIIAIARMAKHALTAGHTTIKVVGFATFVSIISLSFYAFTQDIFITVKVMEPFWFITGLSAAALRPEVQLR